MRLVAPVLGGIDLAHIVIPHHGCRHLGHLQLRKVTPWARIVAGAELGESAGQ